MKLPKKSISSKGKLPETFSDYAGGDPAQFRNTVLMVLERKWYAVAVFLVIALGTLLYTFLSVPKYESVATVQVLKHGPQLLRVADVVESSVTSDNDFNTQIKILESVTIAKNVAAKLTAEEVELLAPPAKAGAKEGRNPIEVILQGRKILPLRFTFMVGVRFQHQNPRMAARIANLIVSEYIAYNTRLRVEESLKAIDELKDRADQQRKRVDEIAAALQAFRQRGNLISLLQSKDIVTERLKALNGMATQSNARLKEAEIRWRQVQDWMKTNRNLAELPMIAGQPKVSQLSQQITTYRLAFEQMRERYKPRHPQWIEITNVLAKAESELTEAIKTAVASVKAEYESALQSDEAARKALAEQEVRSLEVDKSGLEYENLNRDFRVNEHLLESMMARMRETSVTSSIESENARIIDRAYEPNVPVSPQIAINLAIGLSAGLFLGLITAYIIAMVDDRIKTAFDIETMVGLPLIGIIPRVERMTSHDRAQLVFNGADRAATEAFLSVYTSMKLNDECRNARLILVTSTLPGEGKSFVASNLALTFASQGQRTLLVDCDLRKPSVQGAFRLRTTKGVSGYCLQEAPLDSIITRDVHPYLDVIVAGARPRNPIQLFGSKEFETLVAEVARRYDRVVFDTPPVGVVSDALNLLPMMDGAVYAIRFNAVLRRVARRHARSLMATSIPIFGAVFNDLNAGVTGGYYVDQNSKHFKDYYDVGTESIAAPVKREDDLVAGRNA
ncbi:MAG: polysaccharide biosynthesis tyrosine autokinase [Verrucomicrobiota bacterium]